MPQTERRHERLADRLTQIIRRLFAGENLNMRHLAEEFGVSVRTLRRDLRERLTGLDLEYNDGHCRLVTADSAGQRERSGLTLARQSDMEALFPGLDLRLAGALLDETEHSPCCIWPPVALTAVHLPGFSAISLPLLIGATVSPCWRKGSAASASRLTVLSVWNVTGI